MAQKDKAKTAEQIRQASAAETRRQDQQDIATKAMSDNPLDRPTTEAEWVKAQQIDSRMMHRLRKEISGSRHQQQIDLKTWSQRYTTLS